MRVLIETDYEAMSKRAAQIVAQLVRRKPTAVLGLPTGATPIGMYQALVRMHREEGLDFSQVTTFNLDEYEGLPPDDPNSYRYYMQQQFFQGVNVAKERQHLLDGMAADATAECLAYEEAIRRAGGIDLQVLGIGRNGHIAFCEPGSSLAGRTSRVALHPQTRADNARFFAKPEDVPRCALTMGLGTILEARACLILCSGAAKADIWATFLDGPVTPQIPASALHLHPWVIALCDAAAAEKLRHREHYEEVGRTLGDVPLLPPWVFQPELDPRRRRF